MSTAEYPKDPQHHRSAVDVAKSYIDLSHEKHDKTGESYKVLPTLGEKDSLISEKRVSIEIGKHGSFTEAASQSMYKKGFKDLSHEQKNVVLNLYLILTSHGFEMNTVRKEDIWVIDFEKSEFDAILPGTEAIVTRNLEHLDTAQEREDIINGTRGQLTALKSRLTAEAQAILDGKSDTPEHLQGALETGSLVYILKTLGNDNISYKNRMQLLKDRARIFTENPDASGMANEIAGINYYLGQWNVEGQFIDPNTGEGYKGTSEQSRAWVQVIKDIIKGKELPEYMEPDYIPAQGVPAPTPKDAGEETQAIGHERTEGEQLTDGERAIVGEPDIPVPEAAHAPSPAPEVAPTPEPQAAPAEHRESARTRANTAALMIGTGLGARFTDKLNQEGTLIPVDMTVHGIDQGIATLDYAIPALGDGGKGEVKLNKKQIDAFALKKEDDLRLEKPEAAIKVIDKIFKELWEKHSEQLEALKHPSFPDLMLRSMAALGVEDKNYKKGPRVEGLQFQYEAFIGTKDKMTGLIYVHENKRKDAYYQITVHQDGTVGLGASDPGQREVEWTTYDPNQIEALKARIREGLGKKPAPAEAAREKSSALEQFIKDYPGFEKITINGGVTAWERTPAERALEVFGRINYDGWYLAINEGEGGKYQISYFDALKGKKAQREVKNLKMLKTAVGAIMEDQDEWVQRLEASAESRPTEARDPIGEVIASAAPTASEAERDPIGEAIVGEPPHVAPGESVPPLSSDSFEADALAAALKENPLPESAQKIIKDVLRIQNGKAPFEFGGFTFNYQGTMGTSEVFYVGERNAPELKLNIKIDPRTGVAAIILGGRKKIGGSPIPFQNASALERFLQGLAR